ncbi:MAG: RagB/SusD family nutrient uptake outer membrane protein [Prevotella sp.]|nr:RagB/SusD family nutrient uptake outer membrane protein [Prevotella sp.]MCI1684437.1 RagB/SusD family nutrient uptake outer membrane protein [Prevotella sp.]MCI1781273.1 RagB/SusD family nutrient uptake outer membrane protein [Prevotella sp.]MCI1802532.1 RagB/SusD family nutrient uptake outer membrane protein [Prevotella sp.]MCI1816959.1 RagB/SusD family nutrient uptake outer membrane protein [Prevotella sp.]MCI2179747.1 RagB/SusD family nutrient uptake outer membrane protein [Prevotella sp
MKHIFIIFNMVLICFCLTSCNETLTLDNDGHINMSEVFTDRNETRGYLNSCYSYRQNPGIDMASLTDDSYDSRIANAGSRYQYWYNIGLTIDNFGSYSFDGQPWTNYFEGIRKCNVFIANMPSCTAFGTTDEKEGWLAQAYALRAYYYLQLFKRYGQVPLITTDLGTNADYSKIKKATIGQIVTQIVNDCDSALNAPDSEDGFSWNVYDNQNGIMTRAVAYAIKSEAVLYAASPLFSDGTYTWADALKMTGEALYQCVTHDYSLWHTVSPEAQNAYASYFLATPFDKRASDKETIYAMGGQLSIWQTFGLPTNNGVSQAGICPTQELVDAYEMANGEPAITGYSDAAHLQPIINPASGYDENNPYANRDPRFYASIYYNGALRYLDKPSGTKVQTYEGGAEGIDQTTIKHTKTGYYLRKYNNYKSTKSANYDGYSRIFRLAELYMNFAEAAYEAEGPDTKVNIGGSINLSARDAVDSIRERAGMPDLPTGLSKSEFESRYRNERRIEFAFEGQRYFDARRWKILDSFKVITGMDITTDGSQTTYKRFNFSDRVTTDDKYLLYPLERTEANKMLQLTGENWQNSGWE